MRRFLLTIFLIYCGVDTFSQATFSLSDTILIQEVVTVGELKKYQSGAKVETIPAAMFETANDGNLEQLLSRLLPIPLKSNAGSLSTIRLRGSSPDHTSINFGGININSLTLGQANPSNVPLYLFDDVSVQFGSSNTGSESGSIGGAVFLGVQNNWTEGFKAEARVLHGSFGEQLYGTKLFLGNRKFESVTRAYYYYKTNDFTFTNPYYRDFENQVFKIEDTQHNANIENYGLLQELNYKFANKNFMTVKVWLENDWHYIQQNMQTNLFQPDQKETYEDKNLRIWADYKNLVHKFKYQLGVGYVFDKSLYNENQADTIQTQRVIGEASAEYEFSKKTWLKLGSTATRIFPKVYAYSADLQHEERIDFVAAFHQNMFNKLTATLNLRKGFVTGFEVPFTPAFGLDYLALSKEKYVLNVSGNVAKSYRVPTFNDRFWVPGGNPDLQPENGMTYEIGSKLTFCDDDFSGNIKLNVFFMKVDNWILWKNGGSFWYAENVQQVESKGIELMTDWTYNIGKLKTTSGLNYSFTSAQRVQSKNNTNALNRQLEYVPLHSANIFTSSSVGNWDFSIDGNFTAEQYTNEEEYDILPAYFLMNLNASYKIKMNYSNQLRFSAALNNLLDIGYQSAYSYAMPGISYRLSITYNFN
jgi:iron complex outermembrane receptor protein